MAKTQLSWFAAKKQWRKRKKIDGKIKAFYLGDPGVNKTDRRAYEKALQEWRQIEQHLAQNENDQELLARQAAMDLVKQQILNDLGNSEMGEPYLDDVVASVYDNPTNLTLRTLVESSLRSRGVADHPDFKLPDDPTGEFRPTIKMAIKKFCEHSKLQVASENRSAGRHQNIEGYLNAFEDWAGADREISTLGASLLADYHSYLLLAISKKESSPKYAQDRMRTLLQFVKWCWEREWIHSLPRNIGSLSIRVTTKPPKHSDVDTIKRVLATVKPPLRLYMWLCLLCGMTAKDISDLQRSEIDFKACTITRKRSKTHSHENVPTVTYRLPSTVMVEMKKYQSRTKDRFFTNSNGTPLVQDGRNDNVGRPLRRTIRSMNKGKTKKTQLNVKMLRSTSANLLEQDKRFKPIVTLWLGHSPASVKERHYVAADQQLLDEAVEWLASQFGIC